MNRQSKLLGWPLIPSDLASLVDTTTVRVVPSNQCIRVEGTTERPRLPTYLPTYPPRRLPIYLPTYPYNHFVSRLAKQPEVAAGSSSTSSRQAGRQAAASNTGYLLLLHLLLLVLSICLLPRATRPVFPRLPSPSLSSPLRARARRPPPYRRRWNHHHHPGLPTYHTATITARYTRYTRYTLVLFRNRIAATPVALRTTPIRMHIYTRAYIRVYIRTYLTYTRNSDLRTRVHTYVLIRRYTLVLSDAYVHMRAYTRAQRPSVALCLRPEISLACLANHGLDNNTVIDRTNLVLHRLLFFHVHLLLRDHHRLVQPTASSKRVTFHPSR